MTYTDEWRAALLASNLPDRAKLVGIIAAEYADWNTGANCYPSAGTIAKRLRKAPRTVERALADLERYGWLTRSGITRAYNATDYRLTISSDMPVGTSYDKGVGTNADSSDKGVVTKSSQFRQLRQSVPTAEAFSSDTAVGQPPHTSSPEEDEEEEETRQPTPHSGAAVAPVTPLPTITRVQLVAVIERQLRDQWPTHLGRRTRITGAARTHLYALYDTGWNLDQLLAYTATIPEPKSNPAGLLAKHYARALELEPDDYTTADTEALGLILDEHQDQDDADLAGHTHCAHGVPMPMLRSQGIEACADCRAEGRVVAAATDAG